MISAKGRCLFQLLISIYHPLSQTHNLKHMPTYCMSNSGFDVLCIFLSLSNPYSSLWGVGISIILIL